MCMVLQLMWRKEFLLHRTYLWKTLRILTYAFGWLYFTQCLTSVSSINHLLCLLCTVFGSISSKIDEILSINSSDNAFVLGDFNDYDKDWLTYSGRTDRLVNISNDLTQIVNFPTRITDCVYHSPFLLDLFLSSDISICFTKAFLALGNSDHVVVSAFINFPSNSKWYVSFHCITYHYSRADWDSLLITWKMFHGKISLRLVLLLLVNFVSWFRLELMYIYLIVSIRSSLTHLHGF